MSGMFKKDILTIKRGLATIHELQPWLILMMSISVAFEAVSPFINIYMSALVLDELAGGKNLKRLTALVMITICSNLVILLINWAFKHEINIKNALFGRYYEMTISKKILMMDYENVENPTTHTLRAKINEVGNMNGGGIWKLMSSFSELIKSIFTIVFSGILTYSVFTLNSNNVDNGLLSFIVSPASSIILLFMIATSVLFSMHINATVTKKMFVIINGFIPFNRIFGYYVREYIGSYHAGKDVRIYNEKNLIVKESMSLFGDVEKSLNQKSKIQRHYANLNTIASVFISTLVYIFVGVKALYGLFSVGSIVKYIGSINEFINGFSSFMNNLTALRANNEYLQVYFDFIDLHDVKYHGTLPIEKRNDNEYEIEFRNVSFKYPSSDVYVLKNVSLKLNIGERLSIVGMNGSGKTTFIKLLCRLYDPTEGKILLNDIDIKKYDYDEYISIFSVVFQDFKLFSFSLGQNVATSIKYDKDKVEACLAEAGLGERLKAMEKRLDTMIYKDFEETGVEISGGEAQKIAIARALYKDAPFIILDEPTAALDPIAEFEIYSRFNEIVGDKTAIYISHRLSSCRFCHDIAVFNQGEIIQRGSHDELIQDIDGKYHELWYAQAQYYDEKVANSVVPHS